MSSGWMSSLTNRRACMMSMTMWMGIVDTDEEEILEEEMLKEEARKRITERKEKMTLDEWRRAREFLLEGVALMLELIGPVEGQALLEEILGEHDLRKLKGEVDTLDEEIVELEEKERLLREQLTISEDRENTENEAYLKKFDNFLSDFAGCLTGRPVDTLSCVQKKVERSSHKYRKMLLKELNKVRDELRRARIELKELQAQLVQPSKEKVEAELKETGVQVSAEVKMLQPRIPVETEEPEVVEVRELEQAMERKREKEEGKDRK
ncbi:hypothetical protein BGX38DRAFT_1274760 [Terfezia claveryi]|nr:hypothetical protein BGX38DRAFT_1274760 [Terfezia claveryi]